MEDLILDYIKEQYPDTELSSYDISQIMGWVYLWIEEYIEQFVIN